MFQVGVWDDDKIPTDVKYAINVYQQNVWLGGEDIEIDDPNYTIGFKHEAKENNVTHSNIDNMYVKKVINRIQRCVNNKPPLTKSEIKKQNEQ